MTGIDSQRSPELLQFVDTLLAQRGVLDMQLEAEVLDQMRSDLYNRVDSYLKDYLVTLLSDEQLHTLDRLIQEGQEEAVHAHIAASIPSLETVVSEALVSFQSQYLNR